MRFLVPALLVIVCLGACSLQQPFPGQSFYALDATADEPAPASAPTPGRTIRVPRAQVNPPFRSRAFQYRLGEDRFEPTYFDKWSDDPGTLIAAAATNALRADGVPVVAATTTARTSALELHVSHLFADATGAEVEAVVQLRATLVDPEGAVLMSRDFSRHTPVGAGDAADVVAAWRDAFTAILAELADDLR
jgi:uncharacterized lipoprotein YmbA